MSWLRTSARLPPRHGPAHTEIATVQSTDTSWRASQQNNALFDHLVGARQKRFRDSQAECLGGREVDDKLELGRLLDRYIGGLCAAKNLVHQVCRVPEQVGVARPIRYEPAIFDKIADARDRGQPRTKCEREDGRAIGDRELIDHNIKCVGLAPERLEGGCDVRCPPDFEWRNVKPERTSRRLSFLRLQREAAHCRHS